jgi:hypothetical protein
MGPQGDAGPVGPTGPTGPSGDAGPAGPGYDVGFASIVTSANDAGATATVGAFGGSGTTSASVVRNARGDYTVTFNGSYPATIATSALFAEANAVGNLQEASAVVLTATATSISVEIFTFAYAADAGNVDVDDSCYVTVELGQ